MAIAAQVKNKQVEYGRDYASVAYSVATLPFPDPLYDHSGTLVADLPELQPGDRFEPIAFTVRGLSFAGRLQDFAGASVRENPEIVNADGAWTSPSGDQHGYILDFGGMRSILRLLVQSSPMGYVLVLPWLGTDFAPGSLFPSQSGNPPTRLPASSPVSAVSLRGSESQKLYVQVKGKITLEQFLKGCIVESLVFPSNLRASVADKPPFWTHPGPLQGDDKMTGLAEALSALAADLTAPLGPKLTVQSDAPGVIRLPDGFSALTAEKSAAASWAGDAATSLPLQAGVTGTLPLHFPRPLDGKTWELRSLKLKAAPKLAPWIFEAVTPDPGAGAANRALLRIDGRLSAAQGFDLSQDAELHGVGLMLGSPGTAELSIELSPDAGGRPGDAAPGATSGILATKMITVGGDAAWRDILFDKPLPLKAGTYWIGLKAKSGKAAWSAAPGPDALAACYAEDGDGWQAFPRMVPNGPGILPPSPLMPLPSASVASPCAALRIFRTPRPEENQARVVASHPGVTDTVEMSLPAGGGPVEVEWLFPAGNRPLLPPGADGRGTELSIRSLSSGQIDIQAATVFFAWKDG